MIDRTMVIDGSSFIKNLGVVDSVVAGKSRSTSFLIRNGINMNTDLINTALVVAGGMGVSDVDTALKQENIYILAVCDLYEDCLEGAKSCWGGDIFTTRDYAKVLADSDAVIIGRPENWHKKINIVALKQDRHLYCEKPQVLLVEEGQEIIKAFGKSDEILMVGATGGLQYWKGGRDVPDVLLGMFGYSHADQYLAFNLSLRCNFVDGTSGSNFLKIVESKGSMDYGWDYVLLKQNDQAPMEDSYTQEKVNEVEAAQWDRKKIHPSIKTTFKA